ncbi:unnamed protein product [Chironomus riparius]|uniref:Uncharacterized protein n=1 Tax=Chironomus riparius TaxID=315576 RepID=A0A9N9WR07_9DIPT|nr:unnamed protein product [Chironomus riparius]
MKFMAIFVLLFTIFFTFSSGEISKELIEDRDTCKEYLGECMTWCNEKIRMPAKDCPKGSYCCVLLT